jgi:hypothetical protein
LGNARACPPGTNRVGERLRHVPQQPDAVFDRAAIGIVAEIAVVPQELVDQIAIGAVQLHAIKASRHRIFCGMHIIADQAGDFVKPQCTGLRIGLFAGHRMRLARRFCRRSGNGLIAIQEIGMHQPAHMPELEDNASARIVHRVRHWLPRFNMRV